MSTSLAEQLQRYQLPQTSLLIQDKKKPSLLFDPKEAASLKRETVYQIGIDGLEELISKDPIFEQFRTSLFDITSKEVSRAVQNKSFNKTLDKEIQKFLVLLFPYFLLSSAHKCLEWLIHRFQIHQYNRNDILIIILPYHESNVFVRMLQLLKFKENEDFYFLKALQKPGVHLTKQNLLNHAASSTYFIKFVGDFIQLMVNINGRPSQLTVAFNFYCSVFTGALQYVKQVTEPQFTEMLPSLLSGLRSEIPDYCASCYVIIAQLVVKAELSEKILDKFVNKIVLFKITSLKMEALLLLLIIYQSQKNYKKIPTASVVKLAEQDWLPGTLQDLNSNGSYIYPLLEQIVRGVVEIILLSKNKQYKEFFGNLLSGLKFDDHFVETCLHILLDCMCEKSECVEHSLRWLKETIRTLERQYPEQFDKTVYKIYSSQDPAISHRVKQLKLLVKQNLTSASKFELFEKLHHSNHKIRKEALKHVLKDFYNMKDLDKEMIKNCVISNLDDDNIEVVQTALDITEALPVMDIVEQKNQLKILAIKCEKHEKFRRLSGQVMQILFSISNNDWDVVMIFISYFLSHPFEEIKKTLKSLVGSAFSIRNPLFIVEKLLECDRPEHILSVFIKMLNNNTNSTVLQEFLTQTESSIYDKGDMFMKCLMIFTISNIVPIKNDYEISACVVERLANYFKNAPTSKDYKNVPTNSLCEMYTFYLDIAREGKLHTEYFLACLENVFMKTATKKCDLSCVDLSTDEPLVVFFVKISNLLLKKHKDPYKRTSEKFLNKFCKSRQNKIEFILNLCASNNNKLSNDFQQKVFPLLEGMLSEDNIETVTSEESLAVPYLLVMLSSDNENVRRAAVNFLNYLFKHFKKLGTYSALLQGLLNHQEEILLDDQQVPLVIFNLISENTKRKLYSEKLTKSIHNLVDVCCMEKSPIYLQCGLLRAFTFINTIDIFEKISQIALTIYKQGKKDLNLYESSAIEKIISHLNINISSGIKLGTNLWEFIKSTIKDDEDKVVSGGKLLCPSVLILKEIDRDLFAKLETDIKIQVLNLIIEISTVTQNPTILPAATHIFKHLDLDANLIIDHLIKIRDVQSCKQQQTKRKRRVSVVPTIDILDTLEWKQGVTVLEFIQDKKQIRNTEILLPVLFEILKKCLDFDEQVAVEYPKQLLLSVILQCCSKLNPGDLAESAFNMELIVQCIRASQNPQTHHHSLLVLAETAHLIPDQVLHHMMAIFTFMGSSVLRHDDSYSFQILTKTIDIVIPILVEDNSLHKIGQVLRVFVDALLDVPEHRRIPVYKQLLMKLQPKENLYLFLLLVFESNVNHSSQEKPKKSEEETVPRLLDIAADLCRAFPSDTVIYSCIKIIEYLKSLPDEKIESMETDSECVTFNMATHTPKEFRHYKYIIVTFVSNLLASNEFVTQIAELSDSETEAMESLYKDMIINILMYIQRTSKITERSINTPQAQYWRVILHNSHDILDSMNALLTPEMFILVIKGLMVHNLAMVRRRALELLNSKLQHKSAFFSSCDDSEIFALVPPLLAIIETVNGEVDKEQEIVIQTALLSLKLLAKLLGKNRADEFKKILEFIVSLLKSGKATGNVLASVILCLAELCANLGAYAIPSLPDYMPALLKVLKRQKDQETQNLVLLSVLTALHKILEHLSLFMSPYLVKLLCEISVLMSKFSVETENQKLHPLINKLASIKQKIGSSIPPRILIPAVEQSYTALLSKKCFYSIGALMDILAECLSNLKGTEVSPYIPELTNFFLTALQFRANPESTTEGIDAVESHVIKAFTTLVLKLSENTFRTLNDKLYNWAVENKNKDDRIITFYMLSSEISENLKGLFVLFAGHFLSNAAEILNACNVIKTDELYFNDEKKNILLLENVLKTLRNVFLYDSNRFINKQRFDVLMEPLVDQLENTLGGSSALEVRCKQLVIPCIVALVVAAADDSLWKPLNYKVLLKMRHNSPGIRLIALDCLTEMVKRLGDDFLPLSAETVPFLHELLEDEEEQVEKACQKAVQEMEKLLGESVFSKYF